MKHFFKVIPLVCLLVTSYFIYHGIYGNRGVLRLNQIHQEFAYESLVAKNVSHEKELLKRKVEALKKGAPDLIQEEALRVLNVGNEEDLIILEHHPI